MIRDWNLDNILSKVRRRICELEDSLSKYRISDIEEGCVKYRIPANKYTKEIGDNITELKSIKLKLKEII